MQGITVFLNKTEIKADLVSVYLMHRMVVEFRISQIYFPIFLYNFS